MKDHKLANEKVKALLAGEQLSLVVSYSDASASSPGFTVTESIFIERQGLFLKQARELVIINEPKSTAKEGTRPGRLSSGQICFPPDLRSGQLGPAFFFGGTDVQVS